MSENAVPQEQGPKTIDFTNVNVIGLPGGVAITSINGDPTPAQTFNGVGCVVTDGGGGAHTINVPAPPVVPLFAPGVAGIVSDPGAAAATDYLGADNTFRPIPAGGGITSINADVTAAQTLTGNGCTVTDGGGGAHTINVPAPPMQLLSVTTGLDFQAAATYPLYTVPGGVTAAVVMHAILVLTAGDPSITGDGNCTFTSVTTNGINDFSNPLSTAGFNPVSFNLAAMQNLGNAAGTKPFYLPGDIFEVISTGGTDPATFDVYVFGYTFPTNPTSLPGGLVSINGDVTPAQTLVAGAGISIVDGGGGAHTITNTAVPASPSVTQTVSVGDNVPDSTPTVILSTLVPTTGFYQIDANISFAGPFLSPVNFQVGIFDDFNAVEIARTSSHLPAGSGATSINLNCGAAVQSLSGAGHSYSVSVFQDSGGLLVTSADILSSLTLLFVGA